MSEPATAPQESRLIRVIRTNVILLCLAALLFLLLLGVRYLDELLVVLAASLLFSYLFLAPVNLLERFLKKVTARIPFLNARMAAIALVYLLFLLTVAFSVGRFFPSFGRQISGFADELPRYYRHMEQQLADFSKSPSGRDLLMNIPPLPAQAGHQGVSGAEIRRERIEAQEEAAEVVSQNVMDHVSEVIRQVASPLLGNLVTLGTGTLSGLFYLFLGLVLVFYLLLDGEKLKNGVVNLLPISARPFANRLFMEMHTSLYQFTLGHLILTILTLIYMYGVFMVFGLKFAGFLSLFLALSSIVPVIGPWFGLIPMVLVVLFNSAPVALTPILVMVGIFYVLKEYWLTPKIMKNMVEIHPVLIILTFLACLKIAGVGGILYVFPLASLMSVLCRQFQQRFSLASPAD